MTVEHAIQILGILVPLASAVAVARMAMRKTEMETVRARTHKLVQDVQAMPTTLRAYYVDRGEWAQAERSHEHAHETIQARIAALEARR